MIWVAPTFREEHLSAIKWLNQHTVDPFAFFAVRVRVVRIADSPYAPLFEVIERPNNWDRQVAEHARAVSGDRTELGQLRLNFWTHFCSRHPAYGSPSAASSRTVALPGTEAVLVQYYAKETAGVFVRQPRGGTIDDVATSLAPHMDQLAAELGPDRDGTFLLVSSLRVDTRDPANWDRISDWLDDRTRAYRAAFARLEAFG